MTTINVQVKHKIASLVNQNDFIVCGNSDYVINFTFDEEWHDYTIKTARFVTDDGFQEVTFNGDSCNAPKINNTLGVKIGVYAGDLHTTTPAYVDARKSILCGGGTHIEPPEDVYDQLMEQLAEIISGNSGIKKIEFKEVDQQGGNVYTITLKNDETYDFTAPKGSKGDRGQRGERGLTGETGERGLTGNGIQSIVKTSTSGLVDTYTITFTDGNTTSYTVTNAEGASPILDADIDAILNS